MTETPIAKVYILSPLVQNQFQVQIHRKEGHKKIEMYLALYEMQDTLPIASEICCLYCSDLQYATTHNFQRRQMAYEGGWNVPQSKVFQKKKSKSQLHQPTQSQDLLTNRSSKINYYPVSNHKKNFSFLSMILLPLGKRKKK